MKLGMFLLYFILPHFARADFPEDPEPINIVPHHVIQKYPAFVGQESEDSSTENEGLYITLLTVLGNRLYVGARNHVYSIDLDSPHSEGVYFSKKLLWESADAEKESCRMKGESEIHCHNYIKILLKRNDDTLFICGTNAFNPTCRDYKMDTLEQEGEDIKGRGRCPYHPHAGNFALFSDGNLYSATTSDFIGIDAVIYRSLGDRPFLRTAKHNSKWLKIPNFVHAIDYGDYIYFFFREEAVEYFGVEKVILPRVARVCKNDDGGHIALLDKEWTSFLKARLDCSVSGDPPFHFHILQSVTDIVRIDDMDIVLAVFTTPRNSIPGSAVCAYNLEDFDQVFSGKFKEQKSPDSKWTPVPDDEVPTPRPGACVGSKSLEEYASSSDLPDDTLHFIKKHQLMHDSILSIIFEPWFQQTMIRDRLTKITADTTAGPTQDYTVVFIGTEKGKIMKFLASTERTHTLRDGLFLEEMNIYNPDKCNYDGKSHRRIVALQLDKQHGALFVAFPHCVIRAPLARCEHYGTCKAACIAARDPYCGWLDGTCVQILPGATEEFEQDIKNGNTYGMEEC